MYVLQSIFMGRALKGKWAPDKCNLFLLTLHADVLAIDQFMECQPCRHKGLCHPTERRTPCIVQILALDDIRNEIIGDEEVRGISGGQRKRVNVGLELVADPIMLFLDEPTSGLDSTSSKMVISALQQACAYQ